MPVIVMLLIQIKPYMSPYIKGVIFGVFSAFIGEPIFKWLGVYKPKQSNPMYSMSFYFFIFLIAYWMTTRKSHEKISPNN